MRTRTGAALVAACALIGPAHAQHLMGEPGFDACREAVRVGGASIEYSWFKGYCEDPERLKRALKGAAQDEKEYHKWSLRHCSIVKGVDTCR
jgi:hypothetical protein